MNIFWDEIFRGEKFFVAKPSEAKNLSQNPLTPSLATQTSIDFVTRCNRFSCTPSFVFPHQSNSSFVCESSKTCFSCSDSKENTFSSSKFKSFYLNGRRCYAIDFSKAWFDMGSGQSAWNICFRPRNQQTLKSFGLGWFHCGRKCFQSTEWGHRVSIKPRRENF